MIGLIYSVLNSLIILFRLFCIVVFLFLISKGVKNYGINKKRSLVLLVLGITMGYSMFFIGDRTYARVNEETIPIAFETFSSQKSEELENSEYNWKHVSGKNVYGSAKVSNKAEDLEISAVDDYEMPWYDIVIGAFVKDYISYKQEGTIEGIDYCYSPLYSSRDTLCVPCEYKGVITLKKEDEIVIIKYEYNHSYFWLFQSITNIDLFFRENIDLLALANSFNK